MKIAFLGAGAIGGYFGALLHDAGHQVGFVARGETLIRLTTQGLSLADARLDPPSARTLTVPAAATFGELAEQLGGIDVVIVATKALPGNATFGDLADTADTEALAGVPILTTHNSVEVHHVAAELFGADRVLAGVVRTYAERRGPADIVIHPGPLNMNFGLMPNAPEGKQRARTAAVAAELEAVLRAAGFDANLLPDILVDVWTKAMYVTTTGVLGAVAEQPLGYLRGPLRAQLKGLMEEVAAVGRAAGVALPADVVGATLAFADRMPEAATSSMHRDIADGLPNELDAQSGAIRRVGDSVGVDTPLFDLAHNVIEARFTQRH